MPGGHIMKFPHNNHKACLTTGILTRRGRLASTCGQGVDVFLDDALCTGVAVLAVRRHVLVERGAVAAHPKGPAGRQQFPEPGDVGALVLGIIFPREVVVGGEAGEHVNAARGRGVMERMR